MEGVEVLPGVWRFRHGEPEPFTPTATRHHDACVRAMRDLPAPAGCPVPVSGRVTSRGCAVRIPLGAEEQVYGLGLQMQSFGQRGRKRTIRVNADPRVDSGDSHAPVPFYVSNAGYGVLVDTARYATFYVGTNRRAVEEGRTCDPDALPSAHRSRDQDLPSEVLVEVPHARGVDVHVFGGPSMREAIQRYNLFSGGGALPPRWGLGVWYRARTDFSQSDVLAIATEFRERAIPLDVIGLEPGWHTHAYPCTFTWSRSFPDPQGMISDLDSRSLRLNLWEHAFVHRDSPLHDELADHAGDYEVWGGLVPDFCSTEARERFASFHHSQHLALGVAGYKLDECDNSDYTGGWSFPELSTFPSGVDGEQMHSLFGLRYQDAIQRAFQGTGRRTYGLVRSSHALAAPYPYVLYSDLYDHRQFVRALVNSGFAGLLWTPEIRAAASPEDLLRRMQTAVLSPLAMVDCWNLRNPPWKQVERDANNAGLLAPGWERLEEDCRRLLRLRLRLVPYLHSAFVRYRREGLPPFRALVTDQPDDRETWSVDDEYLMGDAFLVAPLFAGEQGRDVYLPPGEWFDFWTSRVYEGGRHHDVEADLDTVPLFVRGGSAVPLAEADRHTGDAASSRIHVRAYGKDAPDSVVLYSDDGSSDPSLDEIVLRWDPALGRGVAIRADGGEPEEPLTLMSWTAVSGGAR